MKTMKRIASALLAVMMMFALSVGAFATETTANGSITITGSASGHTFTAYQILTGTVSGTGKNATLTNPEWGAHAKNKTAGVAVTDDEMTAIQNAAKDSAATLAKDYVDMDKGPSYQTNTEDTDSGGNTISGQYTITGLAPGYYLVKDTSNNKNDSDQVSAYIVEVLNDNVTTESKIGTVESYKKVKDINDSEGTAKTDWQDSADHDIGDAVDFQFVGTLPENYGDYNTTYKYVFHDSQSAGLTFNSVTKVYALNGTTVMEFATSDYKVVSSGLSDGCTFEVQFANLKTTSIASSITKDTEIVVEYTSTLNENAVLGYAGNPNQMQLEYSNNPNDTSSTGKTVWDKVIVFTYKVVVNKVAEDGTTPLTGAEFALYKWVPSDSGKDKYNNEPGTWTTVDLVKGTDGYTFTATGIDDGTYKIVETTAPDGYNKVDDIIFKVTAEHDTTSNSPTLTKLTGNLATGDTYIFTTGDDNSSVSTTVKNEKGLILPVTGSIGTTIFYVVGGVLVVGAAVLLITKVRMRRHE